MAKKGTNRAAKKAAPAKSAVKKTAKKAAKPKAKPRPKAQRRGSERVHAISRVDQFVREYLIDLNGTKAALRAGYSALSARQTASDLLATKAVQDKVQNAMDERAERTGIEADVVLQRFWAIATADARELTELHVGCCRFCWGKENHYQWTPNELRTAKLEFQRQSDSAADEAARKRLVPVDEVGGIGFNPGNDPNPTCPECFGKGVERPIAKDTRDISPAARMLFAGVKTTQHGLEIKTHNQAEALRDVGRHLGLFKDRVELTGKNGGPVKHQTVADILNDIDGSGTGLPDHGSRGS